MSISLLLMGRAPGRATAAGAIHFQHPHYTIRPPFTYILTTIYCEMVATKSLGYHPLVVNIGNKLKEARTRELLTQQELAEKSGVGVNTIIRIERNQVEPHFRTIRKPAEALGIDPKALL